MMRSTRNFHNRDYTRASRRSKSPTSEQPPPPLSIRDAARALIGAVSRERGLDGIDRVWVSRTDVGALYLDGSGGPFPYSEWRSENEADCCFIPEVRYSSRDEFDDDLNSRNCWEHPEQSYRRGFQQGGWEVYQALEAAGLLEERVKKQVREFVRLVVARWRFLSKRLLKRHTHHDAAPKLVIE